MNNTRKIAVYSGEIPSTTFIERLIAGLSKGGHEVLLFGYLKSKKKYPGNVGVYGYSDNRWIKFYLLLKYTLLLTFFRAADKKQLDDYLVKHSKNTTLFRLKCYPVLWHKPDIFHIQWAKSIEDWIWVKQFGIKLVLSLRGTHVTISPLADPILKDRYERCFPEVDAFHAVSKAMANSAMNFGANPDKIKVVYSGLPEQMHIPSVPVKETKVFTILSIGRNHWVKGYNYAIACCRILKEKGLAFEYHIIGAKGSEELEFLIRSHHLENEVKLTPLKPYQEVQQLLQAANLLLLPSVEEGIANVVLEAMQMGTLVLTTHCGGMQEVVIQRENGFMVPVRDVEAMAEAVLEIAALSQDQINALTENAKQTVLKQHSEEKMMQDMVQLYNEVLSK